MYVVISVKTLYTLRLLSCPRGRKQTRQRWEWSQNLPTSLGTQHAIQNMPAPRRGANSSANTPRTASRHDSNLDNSDPTWNTSLAKLPPFLASLKRNDWLFNQVKDALSLVTRGYIVDAKHKKIVSERLALRLRCV